MLHTVFTNNSKYTLHISSHICMFMIHGLLEGEFIQDVSKLGLEKIIYQRCNQLLFRNTRRKRILALFYYVSRYNHSKENFWFEWYVTPNHKLSVDSLTSDYSDLQLGTQLTRSYLCLYRMALLVKQKVITDLFGDWVKS